MASPIMRNSNFASFPDCPTCWNIDLDCPLRQRSNDEIQYEELDSDGSIVLFRTLGGIENSGADGCPICSCLLEILLFFGETTGIERPVSIYINAQLGAQLGVHQNLYIQLYTPLGTFYSPPKAY